MSSRMEMVLKICEILSEEEDITTTMKESAKGTGITGLATLAGALLLGRKGVLAGKILIWLYLSTCKQYNFTIILKKLSLISMNCEV